MAQSQSNDKIQEALDLLSEAARDKRDELREALSKRYLHLRDAFMDMETEAVDKAMNVKDTAEARARGMASRMDHRMKDDPWHTLGWVAVGALVVGFLIGRKD